MKSSLDIVFSLDGDKMLLDRVFASGPIHLKGLQHPRVAVIDVQEVPKADLHFGLIHPQVVGVNEEAVITASDTSNSQLDETVSERV